MCAPSKSMSTPTIEAAARHRPNGDQRNRPLPITSTPSASDDQDNRLLPTTFTPSSKHVVCARGKCYWDHEGNKRYRIIIAAATKKYEEAPSKLDKSLIVSEIIESIHKSGGGFVKKAATGRFVEVSEHFVREKITQSLRDRLTYRSSTKAKKSRRTKVTEKINSNVDKAITSNVGVMSRLSRLNKELEQHGELAPECSIINLFTQANLDILETIKRDKSLLNQFQVATSAAMEAIP